MVKPEDVTERVVMDILANPTRGGYYECEGCYRPISHAELRDHAKSCTPAREAAEDFLSHVEL